VTAECRGNSRRSRPTASACWRRGAALTFPASAAGAG